MVNELNMFYDYFKFFMCFVRKRINISVTLVSEFYVLLYYERKVYMLFINKICINQIPIFGFLFWINNVPRLEYFE
jgi:hypothetical protein